MARYEIDFTFDKSTKNTHRYNETGWRNPAENTAGLPASGEQYAVIGLLYVKKWAFKGATAGHPPPKTIKVVLEIPE